MNISLDQLPYRAPASVASVDWAALEPQDAKRLRNLGLDQGVEVELLHSAPFGRDPIAIRIGRMQVAVRRVHAAAIRVEPLEVLAAE
jgi:ferrous iron transport protein A